MIYLLIIVLQLEQAVLEATEQVFGRNPPQPRVTVTDDRSAHQAWGDMLQKRNELILEYPGSACDLGTYYIKLWQSFRGVHVQERIPRVLNYEARCWSGREVLRVMFHMWAPAAKLRACDEEKQQRMRQKKQERKDREAAEFTLAYESKDWSQCRKLAGKMGGTNVGPRRRRWIRCLTSDPLIAAWVRGQSKNGPEGGCEATVAGTPNQPEILTPGQTLQVEGRNTTYTAEEERTARDMLSQRAFGTAFKDGKTDGRFLMVEPPRRHGNF